MCKVEKSIVNIEDYIMKLYKDDFHFLEGEIDDFLKKYNNGNNIYTEDLMLEELKNKYDKVDIPLEPLMMSSYLEYLDNEVLPYCSNLLSPTYLGHMTSPIPNFISELGKLINFLNQNMVKMETSNGLTFLERQVLGMFHKQLYNFDEEFYNLYLHDSDSTLGIITSGGTLANICAIWTFLKEKMGIRGNSENRQNYVVIGSELMHFSFDKASDLLGFSLERIPTDENYRVNLKLMEEKINECKKKNIVVIGLVGIAGTTEFGSIDPLKGIYDLANKYQLHYHVDAAWGGAFMLCDEYKELFDGIQYADTVTIDGHKQLMLPIGCGLLFYKNSNMSRLIMHHAPYAVRKTSIDQGRFTLEGTRPANVIYLHAVLHLIAKSGYQFILSNSIVNTRYFVDAIKNNSSFELSSDPHLNIVNYRYIPKLKRNKLLTEEDNLYINKFNIMLQRKQRCYGRSFVSRTQVKLDKYFNQEIVLLRAVLLNPKSTKQDIDFLFNDQITIAIELEKDLE